MMKSTFLLLFSNICMLLLLDSSFLSNRARSNFVPVEWSPEVFPSEQCGVTSMSKISDALETVAEMVKRNDIASSLPKSCMEIKEMFLVSPSGYYTISNGSGGSVVVYCDMDELYSCPSLEQTLKGFSNNLEGVSNNLAGISNKLAINSACENIFRSCQEVRDKCPKCTSGYYELLTIDFTKKYVYCSFEEKCGTAGPWTRVAYLNMSDSSSVCPSGTQKFVSGSAIGCGIQEPSDPKCFSITHSIAHTYSEICGQMVGYQKGSPDAFQSGQNDVNGNYVDGVSITRGSPRQHVWTYAIGLQENLYYSSGYLICPCCATSKQQAPSFVGSDYYCESGCPGNFNHATIYSADVLWDGEQCGVLETDCCTNTDQPWFHKVLNTTTSDDLEVRLCINQHTNDENLVVSLYDIYVK